MSHYDDTELKRAWQAFVLKAKAEWPDDSAGFKRLLPSLSAISTEIYGPDQPTVYEDETCNGVTPDIWRKAG